MVFWAVGIFVQSCVRRRTFFVGDSWRILTFTKQNGESSTGSLDQGPPIIGCVMNHLVQLIGLREKLQENPIFNSKIYGFRLRFSLKSTQWLVDEIGRRNYVT